MSVNISQDFDTLNNYFLRRLPGQEQIIRSLLTSIKLRDICQNGKGFGGSDFMPPKLHTLVRGPSGCGKTFSINEMCRQLGIPFVAVNTTDFTSSGYVGASLTDIPQMLIERARDIYEEERRAAEKIKREQVIEEEKKEAKDDPEDAFAGPTTIPQARGHYRRILGELKKHGIDLKPVQSFGGNLYRPPLFKNWKTFSDYFTSWVKNPEGAELPKALSNFINKETMKVENKEEINNLLKELVKPIKKRPRLPSFDKDFMADIFKKFGIDPISGDTDKRGVDEEDLILKLAQSKGVVLFDEFDKIFMDRDGKYNVGTTGVIREILAYLSGSMIPASSSRGRFSGTMFDTSGIVFICAGAFDMVSHKDIPTEVLGRLAVRCKMEHPTEDTFYKMLTYPETGVFNVLKGVLVAKGVNAENIIDDATCLYLAKQLFKDEKKKPIGIRRLTSVINILAADVLLTNPKDLEGFVVNTQSVDKYCAEIRNSLSDF